MNKPLYKRSIIVTLTLMFVITLLCTAAAAMSFRNSISPRENGENNDNQMTDSANQSGDTTNSDSSDTTMPAPGNGTGEFADDTSNSDTSAVTSGDMSSDTSQILKPEDGMATDADGFINDGADTNTSEQDNMSIWGILIAIIIIAAIGILVFVFFAKKR